MKHGHIDFNTTTNTTKQPGRVVFDNASNSLTYNPITVRKNIDKSTFIAFSGCEGL